MQALGPEMKKLQQKYKGAENRAQMNEEVMKLYKEHNVNPASGCLPMLLQMPFFIVLYSVIRGITNTVITPAHTTVVNGIKVVHPAVVVAVPRYIPVGSKMYHNIKAAHGQLISFGMDFSEKLLSHHSSLFVAIPYLLLVGAAVGLQYLQMARLNARNPQAAQANPQAAMLQKYMPLIFGFIYLNVAAILNVYFIVSSAIRILTQEILFRKGLVAGPGPAPAAGSGAKKGPAADRSERALPKPKPAGGSGSGAQKAATNGAGGTKPGGAKAGTPGPKTPAKASTPRKPAGSSGGSANGSNANKSNGNKRAGSTSGNGSTGRSGPSNGAGSAKRGTGANGSNGTGSDADADDAPLPKAHPRSKAKRERKAR